MCIRDRSKKVQPKEENAQTVFEKHKIFLYKEDFNNFKDLKQRIRDRFTNKKRQKKRQARREEQARRAAEEAQRQELLLPEDPPEPEYDLERD